MQCHHDDWTIGNRCLRGAASIHGDWFTLVDTDDETFSISVNSIIAAASSEV